jgi:hypothetical protein
MVQETTGSGTAERKDPAESAIGSGAAATTDVQRDEEAAKLVDRYSLWSGAAGLIPLPLVDIAAVGGVQIQMHFASGGTLLDFNPPDYREFIKAQKEKFGLQSTAASPAAQPTSAPRSAPSQGASATGT